MPQTDFKCDPRSLRSQTSLRDALVQQLGAGEDLSRITVASLTDCAGLTRRTFYSHYKDIPDFIQQVEDAIMDEIRVLVRNIGAATLPELYHSIDELEPAPGAVELLEYLAKNRELIGSLLGPGGDPAFIKRLIDLARDEISGRMHFPCGLGVVFRLLPELCSYRRGGRGSALVRKRTARIAQNHGAHHDGDRLCASRRPVWPAY